MCEILVKAEPGTTYEVNDPVVIMPDGHTWGSREGPPKFIVVKMPGVSVRDAMWLLESRSRTDFVPIYKDDGSGEVENTIEKWEGGKRVGWAWDPNTQEFISKDTQERRKVEESK